VRSRLTIAWVLASGGCFLKITARAKRGWEGARAWRGSPPLGHTAGRDEIGNSRCPSMSFARPPHTNRHPGDDSPSQRCNTAASISLRRHCAFSLSEVTGEGRRAVVFKWRSCLRNLALKFGGGNWSVIGMLQQRRNQQATSALAMKERPSSPQAALLFQKTATAAARAQRHCLRANMGMDSAAETSGMTGSTAWENQFLSFPATRDWYGTIALARHS